IGNTSTKQWGPAKPGEPQKHRSFEYIWAMVFMDDGEGFYVVGYNEGQPPAFRLHQNDYQMARQMTTSDHRYSHQRIATDGERIYIVNNGGAKPSKSIFMYSKKHKHGWNERLLFAEDKWGIAWSDKRFITGLAVE